MTTFKVITGFSRLNDEALDSQAHIAYDSLNPNENFSWDDDVMTRFQSEMNEYHDLLEKVKMGTSGDVLRKNMAKEALTKDMHYIAVEVNQQAQNDLVKLQSSGFPLAKTGSKVGPLPKPTDFKVSSGLNTGELLFEVEANRHSSVYLFFYAEMPAPETISAMNKLVSTTHKRNATGFKPGMQYKCLCAYQGSDTTLVYSDPIYIYAQ